MVKIPIWPPSEYAASNIFVPGSEYGDCSPESVIAETAIVYLEFGKSPLFELEPSAKSLPAEKKIQTYQN